jgi:hypothetical protein
MNGPTSTETMGASGNLRSTPSLRSLQKQPGEDELTAHLAAS